MYVLFCAVVRQRDGEKIAVCKYLEVLCADQSILIFLISIRSRA